jgi:hypothetical protein
MPHIEQDNLYRSGNGTLAYTYSYSYNYNGTPYSYNSSQTYAGSTAFQAHRANPKGKVKPYLSKLDPSAEGVDCPISFSMNSSIGSYTYSYGGSQYYSNYKYGLTLETISDGTSNTTMFGESYSRCSTSYYYDYSQYYGAGSYYKSSYGYDRVWNYDPNNYSYTYSYTYQQNPVKYDYSSSGTTYPVYYYWGSYDRTTYQYVPFEVKPKSTNGSYNCDYSGLQGGTMAGVIVAMCDGSARTISANININTWRALGSPTSGDQPGSNW